MSRILEYCRYNSGRSPLDSGDHYGRHYDRPEIQPTAPVVSLDKYGGAVINTGVWLSERFSVLDEMHEQFDKFCETNEDDWFTASTEFMESLGYIQRARDNTYNTESDLDQCIVWEVWTKDDSNDWIYDDEAISVMFIHTGCDVRGGYSPPLFMRAAGCYDYAFPADIVASYCVTEARNYRRVKYPQPMPLLDWAGVAVDTRPSGRDVIDHTGLDEKWQAGYTGYPWGEVEKDVERVFEYTRTDDSVCAKLHDGTLVKICAAVW